MLSPSLSPVTERQVSYNTVQKQATHTPKATNSGLTPTLEQHSEQRSLSTTQFASLGCFRQVQTS